MSANPARRSFHDPRPQLDSVDLSAIRARYVESKERLPAHVYADLDAMWHEIDKLRFELAGANERTLQARAERQKAEDQIYQLNSRLPGAGRAL